MTGAILLKKAAKTTSARIFVPQFLQNLASVSFAVPHFAHEDRVAVGAGQRRRAVRFGAREILHQREWPSRESSGGELAEIGIADLPHRAIELPSSLIDRSVSAFSRSRSSRLRSLTGSGALALAEETCDRLVQRQPRLESGGQHRRARQKRAQSWAGCCESPQTAWRRRPSSRAARRSAT